MDVRPSLDFRTLRHGRGGPLFAAFSLAVSILAGSSVLAQPESGESLDYDALAAAVDQLEGKLGRVREAVDQTRFDPDELVFSLDFDGEAIVRFVNEEIAFHPYQGLLRGLAGTLQSRSGNSLDQALLLAYLLKTAGLDARVVRGELNDAQARQLLGRTAAPGEAASLEPVRAAIRETFGEAAAKGRPAVDLEQTELAREAEASVGRLNEWLAEAGATPDAGALNAGLASKLGEYFWVEHRDGPGEDWHAAHPAFGGDPGFELEPAEYMAKQIPARYHHRLTVAAYLRQRVQDEYQTHRLMADFTRPVANLHGVVLSYRNNPSGLSPETLDDLETALEGQQILMPVFRGGPAPGAQGFDLKGRTIDPMVLRPEGRGAAGLFAELSDKMEKATSTVIDPDDPKPIFELESMWLEFTLETPGGDKRVQRRYILPPPGAGGRAKEALIWPLITEYAYVVNAGDMPLDYLADRYLATGIESLDTFKAMAHKMIEPEAGTPMPKTEPPKDFGPLALYRVMGTDPRAPDDVIAVRHRPALVGLKAGLRDAGTAFAAVDIVFNDQLQLKLTDAAMRHDPAAALRRGVWETAVERIPGRLRNDETVERVNTMAVFEAAREQDIPIRVLAAGDASAAGKLRMDTGQRSLLERDLEDGYTVVVPAKTPEGFAMSGWWRVDPVSGTTLGMTADGHGQDAVEYIIDQTLTAMTLVRAIGKFRACGGKKTNVEQACCLIQAHMNNVVGLSYGGILGANVSSAFMAVFEIVDFTMETATGDGITPGFKLNCGQFEGTAL